MSIHVTTLFRDPAFYMAFRRQMTPVLRTYPFVRIWLAGCATGEEAYSMAILLDEEGLYERARIYATDMNETALKKAKTAVYPLVNMKEYTVNYQQAGGKQSLSDYYTAQYDHIQLQSGLKRNIVFAQHNLVTDASFNEFHVVLCRNVLIYFNKSLEARVLRLINQSLGLLGFLCLGAKESLKFSVLEKDFEEVDSLNKIYRKIR
jgi:chemotaxis protein methyltransferase CheR